MVLWFGVIFLSFKDVVVLYCFLEVEFDYYLDYVNVSSVEMYLKGYGEFDVFLWNLRKECQFRYYRSGNYIIFVVESNIVSFEGGVEIFL